MMISSSLVFSQVGISTATPLEKLHIAGTSSSTDIGTSGVKKVTPTIRIDGLNSTNNTANLGANRVTPLAADVNGNLVLNSLPNSDVFPGFDQTINVGITSNNSNTNPVPYQELSTTTITLTRPATVTLSTIINALVYNDSSLQTVKDGLIRLVYTQISVDGSAITASNVINSFTASGTNSMSGPITQNATVNVKLGIGTHTISFMGRPVSVANMYVVFSRVRLNAAAFY